MKTIGVTGGIGSGKSVVCRVFQSWGIPVFNSDFHAKKVYQEYPETQEELRSRFGDRVFTNGILDLSKLAAIVFRSEEDLQALNGLIHPYVRKQYSDWFKSQHAPYVIREAAVLFESGSHVDCDKVILVTAPEALKISRVMRRDNLDKNQILERMHRQWDDLRKRELSQFEIVNDDIQPILPQIISIHESIVKG